LAQLENEDPAAAEATYRELAQEVPNDPLPLANLAIATLRQQKSDEALEAIDQSLALAPGRGDLMALKGDVLQWSGKAEEALAAYREAADDRSDDPEVLFSLYRQASTMADSPETEAARSFALQKLTQLRPENVVVLLARGKAAVASGDRAGATEAFLRVKELLWQAPEVAERAMGIVLSALDENDLAAARTPAQRLENVLKVTPMYRESLRELMTGIQGIPVARFGNEPSVSAFGAPGSLTFTAEALSSTPTSGRGLAPGDFDGDGQADIARLTSSEEGDSILEIRLSSGTDARSFPAREGLSALLPTDLNNDGLLDLLGFGPSTLLYWQGSGQGDFTETTADLELAGGASSAIAFDYDIEGDLDLVLAAPGKGGGLDLLRNSLEGPLTSVGEKALPKGGSPQGIRALVASDLDRDGDQDLLIAHNDGLTWLDNLRQGRFQDRTTDSGLEGAAPPEDLLSADLNNDGFPEVVAVGRGVTIYRNLQGQFEAETVALGEFIAVAALDADNDGRLDLAVAGRQGAG